MTMYQFENIDKINNACNKYFVLSYVTAIAEQE